MSYADFLHGLLEEESTARANAATQRRLRQASFPYAATIEQFDFRFRPELKRQVMLRYLDPTFVEQARSLALIGPPGLGKTMLAVCIATKHIQLGATARFITAQQLANQLGRSSTSMGRQRLLRPLLAADVLVLDELGYLRTLPGFGPRFNAFVFEGPGQVGRGRPEPRPRLPARLRGARARGDRSRDRPTGRRSEPPRDPRLLVRRLPRASRRHWRSAHPRGRREHARCRHCGSVSDGAPGHAVEAAGLRPRRRVRRADARQRDGALLPRKRQGRVRHSVGLGVPQGIGSRTTSGACKARSRCRSS